MEGKLEAAAPQRLTQGGILCVSYLTHRGGAVTIVSSDIVVPRRGRRTPLVR
jgi:hypothetical protein